MAARKTQFTGRAAVLLLVFCALVLALAYPFQQYLAQQSQIDNARRQNDQAQQKLTQLRQEQQLWSDPAYVEQQARGRLHYVFPGETSYVVLGPSQLPGAVPPPGSLPGKPAPWYGKLWNSVTSAATPTASPKAGH